MPIMSLQEYGNFTKAHPNRILIMARRQAKDNFDKVEVRICRCRKTIVNVIKKQSSSPHWSHWKPCIPLSDKEIV